MMNRKVIVLSGFARGGTNIVWNILQSHPEIVAPPYETGELFKKSLLLMALAFSKRRLGWRLPLCSRIVDYLLFHYKMESFQHLDNCYVSEGQRYTRQQMEQSALCLKSVNDDILITELLRDVYPNLYFIGLTRNGYALADGYVRRGKTAGDAGRLYLQMSEAMQKCADMVDHFKLIRFEDVLDQPFEVAQNLFEFLEVHPHNLDMLRLKAKKVIRNNGEHTSAFRSENRKYWFTRTSIGEILDCNIDQRQMDRLSKTMIDEFNTFSGSALKYFGYEAVR